MKAWILGTRGSTLALTQTQWVRLRLAQKFPGQKFEVRIIKTLGDSKSTLLAEELPSKGIFTRRIEEALLAKEIDIAVHSLKDLPVELPAGLLLGPVPLREDARDVLVSLDNKTLAKLRKRARIGTGSSRRKLQLLIERPDLDVVAIRGNVQTRVKRVARGGLDAVVLARAGLRRLGLENRIAEIFEPERMLPAVGQGALAIEIRQSDQDALDLIEAVGDPDSTDSVRAERAFLGALGGGCRVPIGGTARCDKGKLTIWGGVFSPDGTRNFRGMLSGDSKDAQALGEKLAGQLMAQGAKEVLV